MGFLAAYVSLKPPKEQERRAKAAWMLVFGLLAGSELWAISHDRATQDRLHERDMREQRQQFDNVVGRLEVLAQLPTLLQRANERYESSLRREIGPITGESKLKTDALLLSRNILQFLNEREFNAPPFSGQAIDYAKRDEYDRATAILYSSRTFPADVMHICEKLAKYDLFCAKTTVGIHIARITLVAQDIGQLAAKLH